MEPLWAYLVRVEGPKAGRIPKWLIPYMTLWAIESEEPREMWNMELLSGRMVTLVCYRMRVDKAFFVMGKNVSLCF